METDVIRRLMRQGMKWVEVGWNHYAYCTKEGEIKAEIMSFGPVGIWYYGKKKYIGKEEAKEAVENDVSSPHPSIQEPRTNLPKSAFDPYDTIEQQDFIQKGK
jgi:hypothetical protein